MSSTSAQIETAWPEGVIARYLTLAGQSLGVPDLAVEIAINDADPDERLYVPRCKGCGEYDWRDNTHELAARNWAQGHANKCRAMPRPTA
ncbi:hypothetical protein [Streptomyces scopuliridis]|uniref:hypothetical protein n=1 Tax=Streptomyces scopuliridis TaxID=452529 RepID=UPI0036968147